MTDKDAIKIAAASSGIEIGDRCFSVPVQAELPEAFWIALLDKLGRSA